jgi:HlyD family secretion protein
MDQSMDIPRPDAARKRRARRVVIGTATAAAILAVTLGLSRLKPAAPAVPRSSVWIDTVKRGPMLRQVRGLGTLVPEEVRWIPSATEGRVERIVVQPGTVVAADTVVLELSNPEVELRALEAESQARAGEASYNELKVRLQSQHLDQEAAAARVQAEYQQARLRAEADDQLAREGLVANLTRQISRSAADELGHRFEIEGKRLAIAQQAIAAQLQVQAADREQRRALARLRRGQREALQVRPGVAGVLQQVSVEVGQQVAPGTNLARVVQPERLKAVIRVPETQARDVQIGQAASVDTRNGIVAGRVSRIDPAVQNGTVTVDIALEGALPRGARPDLTVDGTVELERLADVVQVGRPAQGQPDAKLSLFRLDKDGVHAKRVVVRLGRASVSSVEIVEGLAPGDQVVLSDTSAWDAADRIRLE